MSAVVHLQWQRKFLSSSGSNLLYFQVGHPRESTFPNRALRGFNEDSIHAQCLKCILCVAFDLNLVSSQCTLKRETICTMHNTVKALLSSPTLQYGLRNANLDENLITCYLDYHMLIFEQTITAQLFFI